MKHHVRAFIDEGNDVITIAQLHIDKLRVKLPGISKYDVGEGKPFP